MKKACYIFAIMFLFVALRAEAYIADINGINAIDLEDAILSLQVTTGVSPQVTIRKEADVNQDQKIGIEEAIFILQVVGKIRTVPYLYNDDTFINNISMIFKRIPAGTFRMGSLTTEYGRDSDEIAHNVTITQPYYIQTTEVTQSQWEAVMGTGTNPSYFSTCPQCPVEQVLWEDATAFITAINAKSSWGTYRLPTEAEWEYAARAGSTYSFSNGNITSSASSFICAYDQKLDAMGWYCTNSGGMTHPVAQKQANAWGLYDMHGNVWEWCSDWYGSYSSEAVTDPGGPEAGTYRVIRGGGWFNSPRLHRSANRVMYKTGRKDFLVGFRLVWIPR